jgi:hypothetical protein
VSVHRLQAHIDALAGKRFYRRWTEQTLESLSSAARARARV